LDHFSSLDAVIMAEPEAGGVVEKLEELRDT
jgi:hypothetical protein